MSGRVSIDAGRSTAAPVASPAMAAAASPAPAPSPLNAPAEIAAGREAGRAGAPLAAGAATPSDSPAPATRAASPQAAHLATAGGGAGPIEPERYELAEGRRYVFELERRAFLRLAASGLVVAVAAPAGLAQESGRGGPARGEGGERPDIAAWLHIAEDGAVTVFTGKVEIGQNIRTSLAQAVADELRVSVASIALVMGDTDRTPFDMGTFGSRTTPYMAPQLARAAAAARELLVGEAAARWGLEARVLVVAGGRVTAPDGRALTFGELTRGRPLAGVVPVDLALAPPSAWQVRGQPYKKVGGRDFVSGRHRYTADMVRPGMLHGAVVRPAGYRAALVSVDDGAARAMEGVRVVRDGDFIGVVAPSERLARRAAAAVRAEWRLAEGQPSSDTVFEHLKRRGVGAPRQEEPPAHVAGDVAAARRRAARVLEASYRVPYIAHVPLEPRAAIAEWEGDRLTVWTGTQRPWGVRAELAEAFRMPESRVRVIVPDTGSAYGGKHTGECAVEAARLARAAGRPVRLVWTRGEEFAWGYFRPAGVIDVASALDDTGRLIAWEFDNWNSGAAAIRTPYDVPNQRIAFHPADSPLRQGSYRGLAATANHFAREMEMDAAARAAGADPVEFRLRHLSDLRLRAVLAAAAERAGWPKPSASDRALGIACGTEKGSYVATVAELSPAPSGFRVERLVAAFECGAIVNPDGVRNQVEGCLVQGLGGALFEAVEFAGGQLLNGSLEQYRVPRFRDVPPIDIVLLDRRDLPSAGAGETPIVCVAPAIGSAARAFGSVAAALPVRLEKAR
jgi:isoquinoline 1-oxidoreductase